MKEMVESLQKVWPVTVNDAYVISLISLVFTVAASILGLAISVLTASAATLGCKVTPTIYSTPEIDLS